MKQTGTVLNFYPHGFGFLAADDTREQIYFHITSVVGHLTLRTGDRVSFSTQQHDKGTRATDIQLLDPEAQS